MDEILQKIYMLKGVTASTGILHDVQINCLKLWSLGLIPNSTKLGINFNYDAKLIQLYIDAKSARFKQSKKRINMLVSYVKELLGSEYIVDVLINGSLIFSSRDESEPKTPRKRAKPDPVEAGVDGKGRTDS